MENYMMIDGKKIKIEQADRDSFTREEKQQLLDAHGL